MEILQTLRDFSPSVESYSIDDEAFIDLSGFKHPQIYGEHIREIILKQTLISTTIGISLTKSLAKAAQRLAKKIMAAFSLILKTIFQRP